MPFKVLSRAVGGICKWNITRTFHFGNTDEHPLHIFHHGGADSSWRSDSAVSVLKQQGALPRTETDPLRRNSQNFSVVTSFSQGVEICCFYRFSPASLAHQHQLRTVLMSTKPPPPNWTPPARMTATERLDELAQILSAGLRRIPPEQSSALSALERDCLVDFSPLKSGVRRQRLRNRVGG